MGSWVGLHMEEHVKLKKIIKIISNEQTFGLKFYFSFRL